MTTDTEQRFFAGYDRDERPIATPATERALRAFAQARRITYTDAGALYRDTWDHVVVLYERPELVSEHEFVARIDH